MPEPICRSGCLFENKNSYIMIRAIPDWMARSGLVQRAVVTVETDELRVVRVCMLLHGFLVFLFELGARTGRTDGQTRRVMRP